MGRQIAAIPRIDIIDPPAYIAKEMGMHIHDGVVTRMAAPRRNPPHHAGRLQGVHRAINREQRNPRNAGLHRIEKMLNVRMVVAGFQLAINSQSLTCQAHVGGMK